MSKNEMVAMIEAMNNYDELAAKVKAKADALREQLKEEMVRQNVEELIAGAYILRYTPIISNRFDSTTFKRLYSDLYKDFTKPVSSVFIPSGASMRHRKRVFTPSIVGIFFLMVILGCQAAGLSCPAAIRFITQHRPPQTC